MTALPLLSPMLASAGPVPTATSAWAVEPKLDGWRVLVYVDGAVEVRTRTGRAIGERLPELAGLVDALGGRAAVRPSRRCPHWRARLSLGGAYGGLGAKGGAASSARPSRTAGTPFGSYSKALERGARSPPSAKAKPFARPPVTWWDGAEMHPA